ncbi:hypothetical protein SDC9_205457 [bioreactor metagenome]|uniref:Uncharacterized protein n=1 Tax=bioreactor metagenome TaxID=1076179 RepID=A0A645JDX9_9ZZZZ
MTVNRGIAAMLIISPTTGTSPKAEAMTGAVTNQTAADPRRAPAQFCLAMPTEAQTESAASIESRHPMS